MFGQTRLAKHRGRVPVFLAVSHLPFVRIVVELSVELSHRDRLGVEVKCVHLFVSLALHPKSLLDMFTTSIIRRHHAHGCCSYAKPLCNLAGKKAAVFPIDYIDEGDPAAHQGGGIWLWHEVNGCERKTDCTLR